MANDTEIILIALQKERDELHERILQVDRIINRVKSIEYKHDIPQPDNSTPIMPVNPHPAIDQTSTFPKSADIKIQVLRVIEIIGKAVPLAGIQSEYTAITGSHYKVRETVRSLHCAGILKMIKFKMASRGFMWVKTEWIVNGELLDKFKPLGFDLLYPKEKLIYQ